MRKREGKFMGHAPDNESWPTPLELLDLQDAVKEKKGSVVLSGQTFFIKYEEETFLVYPKDGFVPRGEFLYKTAFDFI
jgi:hypothetical protein